MRLNAYDHLRIFTNFPTFQFANVLSSWLEYSGWRFTVFLWRDLESDLEGDLALGTFRWPLN